jgi:hypothetical protein
VLDLPAAALLWVAVGERCLQQPLPETLRARSASSAGNSIRNGGIAAD